MTHSDEELVKEALRRVAHIENRSEKARRLGVSEATMRRWEAGDIATPLRSRSALERFLASYDESRPGHFVVRESGDIDYDPNPDPEGTPAEQLMAYLGVRVGMRRLAGELTAKDLIAVAYTLARSEGFSAEEYKKLDAWRDQILEEEQGTRS